ncbi:coiled-coil domain-containing protein 103 [Dunckerocampus dactyliophorus]|uniref:coiled-coil domain-containing protein 103 n=1 Tax=Dunckerocampus dactyliophorus TaxID=161453 RepID=UPI002406BE6A|nr:coiled-coil domain-containing protein 103 [Dunckerocampus dactyliophorus]XP_054615033.1 coiled-coil domain-containing protein 103 [Dunckerocampus dactyliophorus]XP_054615034.1 coiled-coil domain-containing protein 103 [Dunckerocampus dactyliophorus]
MAQRDVIDFSALEKELRTSVESERKYKRENDAKLRAVSQGVSSYQQFRDIVLSCHLRPLQRHDKNPSKQPWNPLLGPHTSTHVPPEPE